MFTTSRLTIRSVAALLPLALLLAGVAGVSAQTVINTAPYTISASGKYVLGANLNYTGTSYAITINAANVDLDLDGFYISGPGNTASTSGVIVVNDYANVRIHNGLLANGGFGIVFFGTSNARNYTVEDLIISRCYITGIYMTNAAPGSLVRNNSFSNIGGSTYDTNVTTEAILISGGFRVENNLITNVTATGDSSSYGIDAGSTDFCVGNTISNCTIGISNSKFINNLTYNCTTPFSGGTNATGNN